MDFIQKLRSSGNSLVDKLRGINMPPTTLVPNEDKAIDNTDIFNEINELHTQGTPLSKVRRGIDTMGLPNADEVKNYARKRYFGMQEDLTRALPQKQEDLPQFGEKATNILRKSSEVAMNVLDSPILNPGSAYVEPSLKKGGLNPLLAGAVGLGLDIVAPGPGELKRGKNLTTKFLDYIGAKLAKDPKATLSKQEILDFARRPELKKGEADMLLKKLEEFEPKVDALTQEARKYKSAEVKKFFDQNYGKLSSSDQKQLDKIIYGMRGEYYGEAVLLPKEQKLLDRIMGGVEKISSPSPTVRKPQVKETKFPTFAEYYKHSGGYRSVTEGMDTRGDYIRGVIDTLDGKRNDFGKVTPEIIKETRKMIETHSLNKQRDLFQLDQAVSKSQLTDIYNQATKSSKLPAQDFADSIRRDLLELKPVKVKEPQFEGITLDSRTQETGRIGEGGSRPKNYEEVVFESPITTNGSSHFPNSKNYFAHARGDEVVESGKKIWREQEIQSDALQKEGLERMAQRDVEGYVYPTNKNAFDLKDARYEQLKQLEPFTNDRFGERIMRERIREKASKGYEKYRLPTGETIGKIEGFEDRSWTDISKYVDGDEAIIASPSETLGPKELKVGMRISQVDENIGSFDPDNSWIITDILGDGRFKAVPKDSVEADAFLKGEKIIESTKETFDLTGKSNPQAKRYENWGKFLKNKYGGKIVTDPQGNSWIEIDLRKEMGKLPIEAFGLGAMALGGEDED